MDIIQSDEFKNKLHNLDNFVAFFVYHMVIDEDITDRHIYHLSYFTNLYRRYYSGRISQASLLNELGKIYFDEVTFILKGFRQLEKKNYIIYLEEVVDGLIAFVDLQLEKVKQLQCWI